MEVEKRYRHRETGRETHRGGSIDSETDPPAGRRWKDKMPGRRGWRETETERRSIDRRAQQTLERQRHRNTPRARDRGARGGERGGHICKYRPQGGPDGRDLDRGRETQKRTNQPKGSQKAVAQCTGCVLPQSRRLPV